MNLKRASSIQVTVLGTLPSVSDRVTHSPSRPVLDRAHQRNHIITHTERTCGLRLIPVQKNTAQRVAIQTMVTTLLLFAHEPGHGLLLHHPVLQLLPACIDTSHISVRARGTFALPVPRFRPNILSNLGTDRRISMSDRDQLLLPFNIELPCVEKDGVDMRSKRERQTFCKQSAGVH